ncbi:MAG TPA: acyl-CoA dehydrogenase family protein [Bacillota bacterium]|jgi:alkylation response protein AidB-like acyl-CoA dehydrogenase|nr:acyl-CoA dehydrogenase family protein [Bacillota bacterium]HQD51909.1 acyl-CoA dehydrogenase family protein [Bacillota bacterium]
MNFELNVEQLAIQKMTREFVEKEVIPVAAHYDEIEEMPVELIRRMVRQGYATVSLPEKYGGAGMDQVTLCLVTEELGRGCAGIATSVGANTLAALPILLAGSEEQKEHYLSAIAGGKLASFCLTEPGAGSDVSAIATTALADGDDYVINGVKCFITNGGYADLYVVFALTNPKRGVRSLTPFVVERGTLGLSAGKKEKKMGIRASNTSEVILEEVRVPAGNRLGKEGSGFRAAMETFDLSRPMIGALAVGVARAAYEAAVKYARERVQFGKPIATQQAIQFMLADMAIEIEAARALVFKAAAMAEKQERSLSAYAAMAKAYASDMAMRVTVDALQVLGGYGYIRDYPLEKYMRDAKILQIYEGTNQIQRLIIAEGILKGYI